jgi:predicted transporter
VVVAAFFLFAASIAHKEKEGGDESPHSKFVRSVPMPCCIFSGSRYK